MELGFTKYTRYTKDIVFFYGRSYDRYGYMIYDIDIDI
jgi:hypothetical protein